MAYFRCEKSTKIIKKLLWNNPSPTSAFSAQTISNIDLSKYDGVIVEIKPETSSTTTDTIYCNKNFNGWLKSGVDSARGWAFKRSLQISGQSFIFGTGSGNNADNNAYVIPYNIYGYVYEPDVSEVDKWFLTGVITSPWKCTIWCSDKFGKFRSYIFSSASSTDKFTVDGLFNIGIHSSGNTTYLDVTYLKDCYEEFTGTTKTANTTDSFSFNSFNYYVGKVYREL